MQLKAYHTASQTTLFKIYMYEQFCQGNFWWAGFVNRLLCHTNAQMLWHIGAHIYAFAVNPSHRFAWGWSWICQLAVVDKLLCHTLSTRVLWHIGVHTYSPNCQPTRKDGRSDAPYETELLLWRCAECAGLGSVDQMQWSQCGLHDNYFLHLTQLQRSSYSLKCCIVTSF